MADIFISYTSSDREWAFWIAKELESLGHTQHVHEWEVKGGEDIYRWMETRVGAADHMLCIVSDEYLKAPFSTLERNAALWQAADKRPGFVLLVAVKPCKLPALSDHIRRCELFGVPEDAARIRFKQFLSKRETPETPRFPGKVFAVSNIPIRLPEHFMGRDDALAAIETALKRYEGRVAITALHGLRGVGKTALAATYAERHRDDYRATWWIRAQTEPTMRADLVALGVRLNWVKADKREKPALAAVMERLRHEGEGCLLIYDNAADANALKPYLPPGGQAQVLVTSNAHAWLGLAEPVEIRLWPNEIGVDYLVARTGRATERDAALALSETLGGLPLAHEQAAAYCERLGIGFAEYARRFDAAPTKFLDDTRDAPVEYHDGLTVAKTFALAIDEATRLHPAAEPVIVHAALLAPEPIPLYLFAEGREQFGEPLASALADDGLDEAVAALRTFALLDRETIADERDRSITTECIRLHRLVREVAAARRQGAARNNALRALIEAAAKVYPKEGVYSDPKTWPRARRLDALALPLVNGPAAPQGSEEQAAHLLNALGAFRLGPLAAYAQARPLFERALAIREKMFGSEHRDTAASLNNLARLLRDLGEFAEARLRFERALAIREKVLGSEHRDTAASLNSLAHLLWNQGDFVGARPLFERALAIFEKTLGPEHPRTARTLNNFGRLLRDHGHFAEARSFLQRALAIREKVLGSEHVDTAGSLNSLARLLNDLGNSADARPLFERALAIREKVLGSEHRDTATTMSSLARVLTATGRANEAEALFRKAIAIGEKELGCDHFQTQRYASHYARLLLETRRVTEALTMAQSALAIHEAATGRNHPWTKDSARVTADALDALGRTEEAAALRERYGLKASGG